MASASTIRVAVLEEHDIFRRGIVACLSDDPSIDIVFEAQAGPIRSSPDIAVVSHAVALGERADRAAPTVPLKRAELVQREPFAFVATAEELPPSS